MAQRLFAAGSIAYINNTALVCCRFWLFDALTEEPHMEKVLNK